MAEGNFFFTRRFFALRRRRGVYGVRVASETRWPCGRRGPGQQYPAIKSGVDGQSWRLTMNISISIVIKIDEILYHYYYYTI